MKNKILKAFLIIVLFLLLSSCSSSKSSTYNCYVYYNQLSASPYQRVNYTEAGLRNYNESMKKSKRDNKEYRKIQKNRVKKIYKMQHTKLVP